MPNSDKQKPSLRFVGLGVGRAIKNTMFVFDMPKVVHIRKPSLALLHRTTQILILTYFVIYVMWLNKGYQSFDRAISGITAKIKGIAWMHSHSLGTGLDLGPITLDESEYRLQPVQNSGFYLITRIASQTIQELTYCPETNRLPDARCFDDSHCPAGQMAGFSIFGPDGLAQPEQEIDIDEHGHGVFTGRCIQSAGTCEVFAWCPVQENVKYQPSRLDQSKINQTQLTEPPNILDNHYAVFKDLAFLDSKRRSKVVGSNPTSVDPIFEVVNFTVLLKNSIEFPYFQVKRRNLLPWMTSEYIRQCVYTPNHPRDQYCPKFRIGDIIRIAGSDTNKLLRIGGVLAITITWECNLDWAVDYCLPKYEFFQLDSSGFLMQRNNIIPLGDGYTLKTSSHYGSNNHTNQGKRRILAQVNGIQFLIRVIGRAGKFNLLSFTMRFGSGLALLSIATILNDMILFHFTNERKSYKKATCDDKTLKRLLSIAASAHLPPSKRTLMMKSSRRMLGHRNFGTKEVTPAPELRIPQIEIDHEPTSDWHSKRVSNVTLDEPLSSSQNLIPPLRTNLVQSPRCDSLVSGDVRASSD